MRRVNTFFQLLAIPIICIICIYFLMVQSHKNISSYSKQLGVTQSNQESTPYLELLKFLEGEIIFYQSKYGRFPISEDFKSVLQMNWINQENFKKLINDSEIHYSKSDILYKSDGANFKLIRYKNKDCPYFSTKLKSLNDPRRKCNAYGIWTKKSERW